MANKEYKIRIGGKSWKIMANSAEQAARRAEKLHAKNTRLINQREKGLSNVTRKSVADLPGVAVAALPGSKVRVGNAGREWGSPCSACSSQESPKG